MIHRGRVAVVVPNESITMSCNKPVDVSGCMLQTFASSPSFPWSAHNNVLIVKYELYALCNIQGCNVVLHLFLDRLMYSDVQRLASDYRSVYLCRELFFRCFKRVQFYIILYDSKRFLRASFYLNEWCLIFIIILYNVI